MSLFLAFFINTKSTTPIAASTGVKVEGLNIDIHPAPSIPVKERIHAVTVVPTFAPITTGIAERKDIRPALTKPTSMTVVAEEL